MEDITKRKGPTKEDFEKALSEKLDQQLEKIFSKSIKMDKLTKSAKKIVGDFKNGKN